MGKKWEKRKLLVVFFHSCTIFVFYILSLAGHTKSRLLYEIDKRPTTNQTA